MKKFVLKIMFCSLALALFFTACKSGREVDTVTTENRDGQTITIIEKTLLSLKFSYTSNIKLNSDKTAFLSIPAKGYVDYKKGSTKFLVVSDLNGNLSFEIRGGSRTFTLSEADKRFVTETIQDMLANGAKFP